MSSFENSYCAFVQLLQSWSVSGPDPVGYLENLDREFGSLFQIAEGEFQNYVLNVTAKLLHSMSIELQTHLQRQMDIVGKRVLKEKKIHIVEIPFTSSPGATAAELLKFSKIPIVKDSVFSSGT